MPRGAQTGRVTAGGELTRRRIEQEALRLFYRQGFQVTTMREITSACDITPAAFYNHFRSKEHLLQSLIMRAHDSLEEAISTALAGSGSSGKAQLSALARAMTIWHCHNIEPARVANREFRELAGEILEQVLVRRRHLRDLVEKLISDGRTAGEFRLPGSPAAPTVRITAMSIINLMTSIPDWYRPDGSWRPEELAELYVEIVLRIAAPSAARRAAAS